MKKILLLFCCTPILLMSNAQTHAGNRTISFDANWRFIKDSAMDASSIVYDDSKWRLLDLPHDWSIEDLPDQIPDSIVGAFSRAAAAQRDGGFLTGGTAWYRKHFVLD